MRFFILIINIYQHPISEDDEEAYRQKIAQDRERATNKKRKTISTEHAELARTTGLSGQVVALMAGHDDDDDDDRSDDDRSSSDRKKKSKKSRKKKDYKKKKSSSRSSKRDRKYYYSLVLDEKQITQGSFRTAPSPNLKGKVRLAFGADFHKVGLHNPNLFNQILKRDPLVMLLYGDSAVDGRRNKANMHRADYLLREISQPWKRFVSRTPVYATWDDWDYFSNDTNGIPKNYMASDRELIRNVWKSNWNNPVNDPERKGIYFTTRIGPVEIFMLDTRSCRENNRRNQYTSYLGKEQHEWLKNGLKNSKAPFKIITSGTMWSDYVSNAKDTWGSWDTEGREELFSLIERDKIGGVLLLSGDRHGARGFKIPRKSGFEFYEFEVGTLGGAPGPPAIVEDCPEQIFGYEGTKTIAFGEFNFDTSTDNPNVTFYLIRDTGEILEEHILSLDQLTPKD